MKLTKASAFLRLLLDNNTSTAQAIGLLTTVNDRQLDALGEIAHNLLRNERLDDAALRKYLTSRRKRVFENLSAPSVFKRRRAVLNHPLIVWRALKLASKYLLQALRDEVGAKNGIGSIRSTHRPIA